MDFAIYSKLDAVNWSTLKEVRRSLLHYKHRLTAPKEDTKAMALGRATHTAVFEPHRFLLDYAIFEGKVRRGKEWDECCRANKGKTILSPEQYQTCLDISKAVRAHPVAGPALTPPGEAEKVLTWMDERTELQCKARLDWWRVGLLCDLKTTTNIEERKLAAHVFDMGYHGQGAFYRAGLKANGLDCPPFTIIAVEVGAPHDVGVFEIDDDSMWQGETMVASLLDLVSAGRFSGVWPGRYPEKRTLSLPHWAFPIDTAADDFTALGLEATGTED